MFLDVSFVGSNILMLHYLIFSNVNFIFCCPFPGNMFFISLGILRLHYFEFFISTEYITEFHVAHKLEKSIIPRLLVIILQINRSALGIMYIIVSLFA